MKNGAPGEALTTWGSDSWPGQLGYHVCPNIDELTGLGSFSKFTLDGATANNTVLPIELIDFIAYKNGSTSVLEWFTATEINNEKFILQHSVDGSFFYTIGQVAGAGTTTTPKDYSFIHVDPVNGYNYYRLIQVDYDGTSTYSDIKVVLFDDPVVSDVIIIGNPVQNDVLDIIITSRENMETKVSLYAVDGRKVLGEVVELSKGNTSLKYDLKDLASGTYLLDVSNSSFQRSIKIMKVR